MSAATLVSFLVELVKAVPSLISAVEAVVNAFKTHPTDPAAAQSLALQIIADTQPLVDKLEGK